MEKRKILITNDDGIDADGIRRLAEVAKKFGDVWVVAPESQRSAGSHCITLRGAIEVYPYDFSVEGVKAFATTGMPADNIRIGVLNIVPGKPDVVLSGINFGYNAGTDLQYSATAGAAFEAAFQRIQHVIAFSEGTGEGTSLITDANIEAVLEELIDKPLPYGNIWNVNFPTCKPEELKGIMRDVHVSKSEVFVDHYDETPMEDGRISYKAVGIYHEDAEVGTDLNALFNNYIAIGVVNNIGCK